LYPNNKIRPVTHGPYLQCKPNNFRICRMFYRCSSFWFSGFSQVWIAFQRDWNWFFMSTGFSKYCFRDLKAACVFLLL
jgi:hypothetical protein